MLDNVAGTLYVDDIHFISELPGASVQGSIVEGDTPLSDVTVYAIGETEILQTKTDTSGEYVFETLYQGKPYRLFPMKFGYEFEPGVTSLTPASEEVTTVDFTGALSSYNNLDTTAVADPFDETGLNPDIIYRGVAQWGMSGDERPVIDVTVDKTYEVGFPDAETAEALMPGIEPNPLEGASSPGYAVEIGSSYGYDTLVFGQSFNQDYFVEVDVYCELRDDYQGGYDRVSLGARLNATNPNAPKLDAPGDQAS